MWDLKEILATRTPVRLCQNPSCRRPVVGHVTSATCPRCKIEKMFDPRDGMTRSWDRLVGWVPDGCLAVAYERSCDEP